MIKKLGRIEVPQYLIDIIDERRPGEHDSFVAGIDIPEELIKFADDHGFEIHENGQALLFSSQVGVRTHADETFSMIWVLCGTDSAGHGQPGLYSHELVCDGQVHGLSDGYVYFVDTAKNHAVIATNHELWAVISMYVSQEA